MSGPCLDVVPFSPCHVLQCSQLTGLKRFICRLGRLRHLPRTLGMLNVTWQCEKDISNVERYRTSQPEAGYKKLVIFVTTLYTSSPVPSVIATLQVVVLLRGAKPGV